VDSAGTQVETQISEQTRKYLARHNSVQYLKKAPESLKTKRLKDYDLIVAMEQVHRNVILSGCPECLGKVVVWHIEDLGVRPPENIEKINRSIEEKVTELAKSL
jgi:protein-tyrosine-phosphatase